MKKTATGIAGLALALVLGACAASDETRGEIGSVGVALVTTGSDGAFYRLTPGTRLSLTRGAQGPVQANYDVSLDSDATSVTFPVPPGDYQAWIYHPAGGYTTEWPLERINPDETWETVTADLVTPQPVPLTVVQGATTTLVLELRIPTGGTISFNRGSVAVAIDVGEQQATSFATSLQGTGDVIGTPVFAGAQAETLRTLLPDTGATGLQISVGGQLTGPWEEAGGSAEPDSLAYSICAPLSITSASASGSTGLAALVQETGHGDAPSFLFGPASICIVDGGDAVPNQVRIRMSRQGAAETPTFADLFGTDPLLFWIIIRGDLPQRVYDSQNGWLDLDALRRAHDLNMTMRPLLGDDVTSEIYYVSTVSGQMTYSFVGQL